MYKFYILSDVAYSIYYIYLKEDTLMFAHMTNDTQKRNPLNRT